MNLKILRLCKGCEQVAGLAGEALEALAGARGVVAGAAAGAVAAILAALSAHGVRSAGALHCNAREHETTVVVVRQKGNDANSDSVYLESGVEQRPDCVTHLESNQHLGNHYRIGSHTVACRRRRRSRCWSILLPCCHP